MKLAHGSTPDFRAPDGSGVPGSVAILERPTIGGCPQGILVRGRSVANPALLILHGGPGGAYIGCARSWFGRLEDHWVVVNLDMRGSGLSYSRQVSPQSLTADQIAQDVGAVVDWVTRRCGIRRWFLLGHSFGTLAAPHVLRRFPDQFESYVAVSPTPTDSQAESESYAWTLARAHHLEDRRAIRDLERIGSPPYQTRYGGLNVRAKWTDRLGGAITGSSGSDLGFAAMRAGSVYTWGDLFFRFLPGIRFWMRNLDPSLTNTPSEGWYWQSPIPTTFVQGTEDWMAPMTASRRYFNRLVAPRKRFVELNGVGHYPFVQSPESFAGALDSELPSIPPKLR